MNALSPVFTTHELMVLTSVLGGAAFYGLKPETRMDRQDVILTTNELARRGVLTMTDDSFRVADSGLEQLLGPVTAPEAVIYLTPESQDLPQVYYLFHGGKGVGFESVFVQNDAFRLFPIDPSQLSDDIMARIGVESGTGGAAPTGDAEEERGAARPAGGAPEAPEPPLAVLELFDTGKQTMVLKKMLARAGDGAGVIAFEKDREEDASDLNRVVDRIFNDFGREG